jgi:hypothetical protein
VAKPTGLTCAALAVLLDATSRRERLRPFRTFIDWDDVQDVRQDELLLLATDRGVDDTIQDLQLFRQKCPLLAIIEHRYNVHVDPLALTAQFIRATGSYGLMLNSWLT